MSPSFRLDRFLREQDFEGSSWISRANWSRLFNEGRITNERGDRLVAGSCPQKTASVLVNLPSAIHATGINKSIHQIAPSFFDSNKNFMVFNKPATIHTMPLAPWESDSLLNGVATYLSNENIISREDFSSLSHFPYIEGGFCNRLDRDTSGLVLAALDPTTKEAFRRAYSLSNIKKTYLVAVEGRMPNMGQISFVASARPVSVEKELGSSATQPARGQEAPAANAEMHVSILSQSKEYSLVRVETTCGIRHVVRLGMRYLGHIVVGDFKYGAQPSPVTHHLLHAASTEAQADVTTTNGDVIIPKGTKLTCPVPPEFVEQASVLGLSVPAEY